MVTRNIKANTATQVNSNLIGVLVHTNTIPPTVTVDDIVVDYTYTKFVIDAGVPRPGVPNPNPENPDDYAEAITDNNNNVYWLTGESFEIDAENIYLKMVLWPQTNTADDNSFWVKMITPDLTLPGPGSSIFKIDRTDSENPVITDAGITVGSLFIDGFGPGNDFYFIQIGESNLYNSYFGLNYYVDGDFLIDTHNGYKVGYVVSGPALVTDPDVTFTKGNVEEGYQTWTNNNYSEVFGTMNLYTPTDSPAVGDKALFTLFEVKYEYNPQTIKAIDKTETPGVTDPVNCKLSYSVDGRTWTDWPENITDDNNVISNIPRYMYLKFSQDVVITEE